MTNSKKQWRNIISRLAKKYLDPLNLDTFDLSNLSLEGPSMIDGTAIEQAASLLDRAHRTFIFMGSGLSKDSGIATFRGDEDSLYQKAVMDLTRIQTFQTNPSKQLQWHTQWFDNIKHAEPNTGHHALARIIDRGGHHTMVTQNVDLLLEQALEQHHIEAPVFHLHGRIDQTKGHHPNCTQSHVSWTQQWCQTCDQQLRPNVVWFGEQLDQKMTQQLTQAALACDVCLVIGTSGLVYPAALIPELAREAGARLIEINPYPTALSAYCDVQVTQPASFALSMIEASMCRRSSNMS